MRGGGEKRGRAAWRMIANVLDDRPAAAAARGEGAECGMVGSGSAIAQQRNCSEAAGGPPRRGDGKRGEEK